MDLAEEAKSLWPIGSIFSAPLLDTNSGKFGPVFFNPSPQTLTHIPISPSLPSFSPSPSPSLSLSTFLETTPDSFILPSTSPSIASFLLGGPELNHTPLPNYNTLQSINCSGSGRVLLFYPVGQNLDQLGFVLLSVEDGKIVVKFSGAVNSLNHRISSLLVQKIEDASSSGDFGLVLICTMYSVYWYSVHLGFHSNAPKLELLGSKCFRTCVVHACWNPHLPEECLVLLESGKLFLFDLESLCFGSESLSNIFKGKNLRVAWDDVPSEGSWFSCEFSWHPRILVVAHSGAVFLVDLRMDECKVQCLLRISLLASASGNFVEKNDRFVAFSRAGPDGFYYTVASHSLLFLCDVRKPLKPVLQWSHSIDNPAYITVVKLSKLRSNSKNDEYMWASKNGYCILMGSFWNCEFCIFCYGPTTRTCAASEISRFCNSLYAWQLPSELMLQPNDCWCGSCLVREEFAKDDLPEWIDWQLKKERVFGFCILAEDLSVQLFEPENFGGFTVIRLMSSSNLQLQRYFASHEVVNFSDKAHNESSILLKESLIYASGDEEHKFSKRFYFRNFEYLYGHLNNKLGKVLMNKKKETSDNAPEVSSNPDFHQDICQKLKACGINETRSSGDISYAVRDIVCPASMMEIAVMSMWLSLPPTLLGMGFVTYVDLCNITVSKNNLSSQFLDVPNQPQLPPLNFQNPSQCSNKWVYKMQCGNALVGPAAPLHFLVTYGKLYIEEAADEDSAKCLLDVECNKVTQMVNKVVRDSDYENPTKKREHAVSLANDKDDMCDGSQDGCRFSTYEPVACLNKISNVDHPASASSTFENQSYSTFLSRCCPKEANSSDKPEFIKPEAIDVICRTGLKFQDRAIVHLPAEFKYFLGQRKKFNNTFTAKRSSFRK